MKLSKFGEKFTAKSGILELMDDLGSAVAAGGKDMCMLGGGNPAHIAEVQEIYRQELMNILADGKSFENIISNYDTPQGNSEFLEEFAAFLNREYGWNLTKKNICITNGSQSGFFILFNMIAGEFASGSSKKILFPIVPEYIGYADQGISEEFFIANPPLIDFIDKHRFKYRIDFESLKDTIERHRDEIAAIALSRPTNPTGNVVTDDELAKLDILAKEIGVPLIIDNAYGSPFPDVIFSDTSLIWDENIILSMSLSKSGLPTMRTGIFVASEEVVEQISSINAILSLANGTLGQALFTPLLKNSRIRQLSTGIIKPFYKEKSDFAQEILFNECDPKLPWHLHLNEGSFFLWLYLENYPESTRSLYSKLKERNVIVVPGEYFFPGLEDQNWKHRYECIRINYGRDKDEIERGFSILAEEIQKGYSG